MRHWLIALAFAGIGLVSACTPEDLASLRPTATPPRSRQTEIVLDLPTPTLEPTATLVPLPTPTDTSTPAPATSTPTATQTGTPTATLRPPTSTATRRPPTATFTRRPPTLTFTPRPPTLTPTITNTPVPPFPLVYKWVNTGRPFDANECTWLNGTHITGMVRHADGTPVTGAGKAAIMHMWIKGDGGGAFAYPGLYRDFPSLSNGQWDADFPRRAQDFEWHIFISAKASDDPISTDLSGVSSSADKCGQAGTKNYFIADWYQN